MAGDNIPTRHYVTYYGMALFFVTSFVGFLYLDTQENMWSRFLEHPESPANVTSFVTMDGVKYQANPSKPKYVLFWNRPSFMTFDIFKDCRYKCILTTNKSKMNSQDAVLYHAPNLGGRPPKKPPGQVWVYFGVEPPSVYSSVFHSWRRVFNWTLNFRRDSDIISRYGSFKSRHLKTTNKNASLICALNVQKNRTAVWFVGHCRTTSRREAYVKVMQRNIHVGIYGRCGPLKCNLNDGTGTWGYACLKKAEKHAKYYLSFENSICRDYVTEKAFKVYRTNALVPIMRGGANYSLYFPPDTFIDSGKFKDATALSKYLMEINTNKSKCTRLFENRNLHSLHVNDNWGPKPFCEMCRRFHFPDKYRRLYDDVSLWFRGTKDSPACKPPTDIS